MRVSKDSFLKYSANLSDIIHAHIAIYLPDLY